MKDYTDNINIKNINNHKNNNIIIQPHNSSWIIYNFENPLNYDKANFKNNFKKYSNYSIYINPKNRLIDDDQENQNISSHDKKRKKIKSYSKFQIRLQNNMDNNNYINNISRTNNSKYKSNKNKGLNVSNDN